MSCTMTITGATLNPATGVMTVQGTLTFTQPCGAASPNISIRVRCGPTGILYTGSGTWDSNTTTWLATVQGVQCSCDSHVLVDAVASCPGVPPATVFSCGAPTLTINNLCCCPQINTQFVTGSCTGNYQLVTFNTSYVNNTACAFTVRRAFGDGLFGNVFPIPAYSSGNLPSESHSFASPASYTSTVDVLAPAPLSACIGLNPVPFVISCTGGCYSSNLVATLCRFLEWLFMFSFTLGLAIGMSQPCVPLAAAAVAAGAGFLALAAFLLLQCNKCTCDFWLRDWGEILIAVGFVSLMFTPPGCSAIKGFPAFINTIIFLSLGFVILWAWYNNNKQTCPLTICDFWCAVSGIQNIRSATNLALVVAIVLWSMTLGALTAGLGVVLLVILVFALYIWNNGPLSKPPCKHNPTCQ